MRAQGLNAVFKRFLEADLHETGHGFVGEDLDGVRHGVNVH